MEGLEITKVTPRDAGELFNIVNSSRPYLRQWLPWVDNTIGLTDTLSFILQFKDKDLFSGREPFVIRFNSQIAGMIDLQNGDRYNSKAEIGYWLAESFQGKGIITECCKILINKAFYEYGINRVSIKAAEGNLKSRHIPERLGFVKEGIERAGEYLNGEYVDLVVYSMLKSEWKMNNNITATHAK